MKNGLAVPFIKWVGGKRQLLNEISLYIPKKINTYFEPFVGGGAVLFHIQPEKALINDFNSDLITTYKIIRNNPFELLESLKKHQNTSEYFYNIRDKDRDSKEYRNISDIERASRLIYLNKTCYNGLFRVNSSGQFNTPFGSYKNPNIVNEPTIKAVSQYLNNSKVEIITGDFEKAVNDAKEGDFVYFDPPYDPVTDTANFTGYTECGFGRTEQERLKGLCDELNIKGVKFLLSNSSTEYIRSLYKDYEQVIVKAKRSLNANGKGRGEVDELLIRNYK
ncbi:MAG: DNA adenine methylase [Erysipelotrichales bacterium]|nr:DNA adenine methylase [Erysipelotrichales bacterium]